MLLNHPEATVLSSANFLVPASTPSAQLPAPAISESLHYSHSEAAPAPPADPGTMIDPAVARPAELLASTAAVIARWQTRPFFRFFPVVDAGHHFHAQGQRVVLRYRRRQRKVSWLHQSVVGSPGEQSCGSG